MVLGEGGFSWEALRALRESVCLDTNRVGFLGTPASRGHGHGHRYGIQNLDFASDYIISCIMEFQRGWFVFLSLDRL